MFSIYSYNSINRILNLLLYKCVFFFFVNQILFLSTKITNDRR